MGKYWVCFTYDMDLLGNSLMGFIVMFGGSLWSPVGESLHCAKGGGE